MDHRVDEDITQSEQRPLIVDKPGIDALDAYQFNLTTVLDLLKRRDLEYFVERSTWGMQPVIGLSESGAATLIADLRSESALRPVSITLRGRAGSITKLPIQEIPHELLHPDAQTNFVVFTELREDETRRRFGEAYGCVVDVWGDASGELRKQRPLVPTTPLVPADVRVRPQPTTVLGQDAVTYRPFDRPSTFDVDFPVDLVIYWVDGADRRWRKRKAKRARDTGAEYGEEPELDYRYRQFDELRYALRSVERFAPWVQRIFLVTDGQRPHWLDERDTNLEVIDHTQILPESALPTFNPRAITACLHRIPGLADHFLYLNDDVLFGRPTPLSRFFRSNGVSQFFLSKSLLAPTPGTDLEKARNRTADLTESLVGIRPSQLLKHTPHALHRPLLAELEIEVGEAWERTIHSPFRSAGDVIPEYLHHHVAYARRMAAPGPVSYGYFALGQPEGTKALRMYPSTEPSEVLCVNDLGASADQLERDSVFLHEFLVGQWPKPSRYERAG